MNALRVLVISRNYPNNVIDVMGLWVQGPVLESARFCSVKVIAPVPYCPPLPFLPQDFSRYRRVQRSRWDGGVQVFHPRFLTGPRYSTSRIELRLYQAAVRKQADRLRGEFPFDLIHAHFTDPDGIVASALGRRYRVPVVITEQNIWGEWVGQNRALLQEAIQAVRGCKRFIVVSEFARSTVERHAGKIEDAVVIPDSVDGSVFCLPPNGQERIPDQILFAGLLRPVKGVDILLRALRILADRGCMVKLVLATAAVFASHRREEQRLRTMARELNIEDRVRFAGKQSHPELAGLMQQSAALVLPSRSESLGMVLVEALACGTPVVATRCGGPEEILNERVGVLAPREDPEALAGAIESVLSRRMSYDAAGLRAYALEKFGAEQVGRRLMRVYEEALLF
jgi:teichuronic acid biosynthesis glycosyltransferase TuaC